MEAFALCEEAQRVARIAHPRQAIGAIKNCRRLKRLARRLREGVSLSEQQRADYDVMVSELRAFIEAHRALAQSGGAFFDIEKGGEEYKDYVQKWANDTANAIQNSIANGIAKLSTDDTFKANCFDNDLKPDVTARQMVSATREYINEIKDIWAIYSETLSISYMNDFGYTVNIMNKTKDELCTAAFKLLYNNYLTDSGESSYDHRIFTLLCVWRNYILEYLGGLIAFINTFLAKLGFDENTVGKTFGYEATLEKGYKRGLDLFIVKTMHPDDWELVVPSLPFDDDQLNSMKEELIVDIEGRKVGVTEWPPAGGGAKSRRRNKIIAKSGRRLHVTRHNRKHM